jgi:hypothetical protein
VVIRPNTWQGNGIIEAGADASLNINNQVYPQKVAGTIQYINGQVLVFK